MEKIYEIPRARAARELCADSVLVKSTVNLCMYTQPRVYTAVLGVLVDLNLDLLNLVDLDLQL